MKYRGYFSRGNDYPVTERDWGEAILLTLMPAGSLMFDLRCAGWHFLRIMPEEDPPPPTPPRAKGKAREILHDLRPKPRRARSE